MEALAVPARKADAQGVPQYVSTHDAERFDEMIGRAAHDRRVLGCQRPVARRKSEYGDAFMRVTRRGRNAENAEWALSKPTRPASTRELSR